MNSTEILNDESKAPSRQRDFIWKYGVLGWGLPTSIFWALLTAYFEGFDQLPVLLMISLAMSPIAGFLFGWMLWTLIEFQRRHSVPTGPSSVDSR